MCQVVGSRWPHCHHRFAHLPLPSSPTHLCTTYHLLSTTYYLFLAPTTYYNPPPPLASGCCYNIFQQSVMCYFCHLLSQPTFTIATYQHLPTYIVVDPPTCPPIDLPTYQPTNRPSYDSMHLLITSNLLYSTCFGDLPHSIGSMAACMFGSVLRSGW